MFSIPLWYFLVVQNFLLVVLYLFKVFIFIICFLFLLVLINFILSFFIDDPGDLDTAVMGCGCVTFIGLLILSIILSFIFEGRSDGDDGPDFKPETPYVDEYEW